VGDRHDEDQERGERRVIPSVECLLAHHIVLCAFAATELRVSDLSEDLRYFVDSCYCLVPWRIYNSSAERCFDTTIHSVCFLQSYDVKAKTTS
jgi:hypothetical protein